MPPILDAIAEIEVQGPNAQISYLEVAKKYSVNRNTLRRRHLGSTRTNVWKGLGLRGKCNNELDEFDTELSSL